MNLTNRINAFGEINFSFDEGEWVGGRISSIPNVTILLKQNACVMLTRQSFSLGICDTGGVRVERVKEEVVASSDCFKNLCTFFVGWSFHF